MIEFLEVAVYFDPAPPEGEPEEHEGVGELDELPVPLDDPDVPEL